MRGLWRPILVAAIAAAALDLIYASIHIGGINHMSPVQIFQSVASGLFGRETYKMGATSAAIGVALEVLMTAMMATVYIVAARWMTDLRRFWWLTGPSYGLNLMLVMYIVVLPLSAVHGNSKLPDGPAPPPGQPIDHQLLYGTIFAHMFLVGLVISAAARFLWPREAEAAAA